MHGTSCSIKRNICLGLFWAMFLFSVNGQNIGLRTYRIGTWNLEQLGGKKRGFPEYRQGIPDRNTTNFDHIARLIRDTLQMDIIGLQEVAIQYRSKGTSYNRSLDRIVNALGADWAYYLTNLKGKSKEANMQNAFLYNTKVWKAVGFGEMLVPDYQVGSKPLFDRIPLVGYFEALEPTIQNKGLAVVNVHLASGQTNDENHLAAMVIVEQGIATTLKAMGISAYEQDRIILGDFNDNPFKKKLGGGAQYISLLYDYLEAKGYTHLVDASFVSTRTSRNFNSIIDHILVSKGLRDNICSERAQMYTWYPFDKEARYLWRKTYSDHFPLFVELELR